MALRPGHGGEKCGGAHRNGKALVWSKIEEDLKAGFKSGAERREMPTRTDLLISEIADLFGTRFGQYSIQRFAKARGYAETDLDGLNKSEIVARLLRDASQFGPDEMIRLAKALRRIHKLEPDEQEDFEELLSALADVAAPVIQREVEGYQEAVMAPAATFATEEYGVRWDVAISFAGENRGEADELAKAMVTRGVRVFYDEFYKGEMWGRKLTGYFRPVYGPGTKYVIVLISRHYPIKDWANFEFSIAKEEARRRKEEFILPVRLDETKLLGLHEDVAYLDFYEEGPEGIAELIVEKLGIARLPEAADVYVATVGVSLPDLVEDSELSPEQLEQYPQTCDWLESDLEGRLRSSLIGNFQLTEDSRNGESLSIRFAFWWNPSEGSPPLDNLGYWNLLELRPAQEIYPEDYSRLREALEERSA